MIQEIRFRGFFSETKIRRKPKMGGRRTWHISKALKPAKGGKTPVFTRRERKKKQIMGRKFPAEEDRGFSTKMGWDAGTDV